MNGGLSISNIKTGNLCYEIPRIESYFQIRLRNVCQTDAVELTLLEVKLIAAVIEISL
jgi:hypothetical protein